MKRILSSLTLALLCFAVQAQTYPLAHYDELSDGEPTDYAAWQRLPQRVHASWASRDVHYTKRAVPPMAGAEVTDTVVYAWRGERLGVQALLYSPVATAGLSLSASKWQRTDGRGAIPASACAPRFVRYVMTDAYRACGGHPEGLPPRLVPDVIDLEGTLALESESVRPVWCTLEVPRSAKPGEYALTVCARETNSGSEVARLRLRVVVREGVLPEPKEQAFHLDFWQQPYAIARYHGVKPWSAEHLEALRPYMQLLGRAGQKVVSAILFYEPWGDQSHDKFAPMVETIRSADGTWRYDYSVFDRWVKFMESCGIEKQINCFSMVPWDMSFRYYDEAKGEYAFLKTATSTAEYRELWDSFITSFAAHLKEKGWFDRTCIAMDERGLGNMLDAYAVAQEAAPGIKMALAGNYHKELVDKLHDYCIAIGQHFTPEELAARRAQGRVSTVYTCCSTPEPNIFSNNRTADSAYLPLYAVANGFDGYLHWALTNWGEDPLRDSRYRLFAPGDMYCIYPGARSSLRFERLIEGIQAAEKVRLLREAYREQGNTQALQALEQALENFRPDVVDSDQYTSEQVAAIEALLNQS